METSSENPESVEVTLVGKPYSALAISPNNQILVASTGSVCEVFPTEKGASSRRVLKHDSDIVAVFFQSDDRLVTVTENGEVTEYELEVNKFEKLVSRRVTAFPVVCAFAQKYNNDEKKELELWLVVKKGDSNKAKKYDVCVTGANGSIEKVLEIPSTLRKEHIFIGDAVITYCQGLEITSIILSDDEHTVVKETKFTAKNGGGEGETQVHQFERLSANGNFLVASISDGRVLQWSSLKSAGVSDTHHRIHWHKVGVHVAVTEFGNVLSAGAECVLARHTRGQKEPTLLPRLMAPVTGLVLSDDSSTCALIMEDNSIHTVLLATMAIKSSLSTLEYCPRSLNTVFHRDPLRTRNVIINGKPGTIQWFDPVAVSTQMKMNVTLENTIDGDMSSRGIRCAFRDVLAVSINPILLATIEKVVNFDGDNHLRFWQRLESNPKLVASVSVPQDVVFVSTCQSENSSRYEKTIITASTSGTLSVWEYTEKDVREDLERSRNWQESQINAISSIQSDGKFVSAHGKHAVLWNVRNMKIVEALSCDDDIQTVEFSSDGRYLIISTKTGVVCWDTLCLLVVWRIQQSVGIYIDSVGCFAFDGPQVMRFDVESGRVLETIQFSEPVTQLIVIQQRKDALVYVAKTAKGILCIRPPHIRTSGGKGKQKSTGTPFQQLARIPQSASSTVNSASGFVKQPRPEAARLFAGPVHQLPPISFIAPLFIEKSLLPPPIRS